MFYFAVFRIKTFTQIFVESNIFLPCSTCRKSRLLSAFIYCCLSSYFTSTRTLESELIKHVPSPFPFDPPCVGWRWSSEKLVEIRESPREFSFMFSVRTLAPAIVPVINFLPSKRAVVNARHRQRRYTLRVPAGECSSLVQWRSIGMNFLDTERETKFWENRKRTTFEKR